MRDSAIQSWMSPLSTTRLPKVAALHGSVDHQGEGPLGDADGPHAVVDAPGSEPCLGDGEPAALLSEQVVGGNDDVLVVDLGVPARPLVVVAEHVRLTPDGHPRRLLGHDEHRLLQVLGASGSVLPITIRTLQRSRRAPDVNHFVPLRT